jgi:hypothetical protein
MSDIDTTPCTAQSVAAWLVEKHGVTKQQANGAVKTALKQEGLGEKFALWEAMGWNTDDIGHEVAVHKGWT